MPHYHQPRPVSSQDAPAPQRQTQRVVTPQIRPASALERELIEDYYLLHQQRISLADLRLFLS